MGTTDPWPWVGSAGRHSRLTVRNKRPKLPLSDQVGAIIMSLPSKAGNACQHKTLHHHVHRSTSRALNSHEQCPMPCRPTRDILVVLSGRVMICHRADAGVSRWSRQGQPCQGLQSGEAAKTRPCSFSAVVDVDRDRSLTIS
jgi:hypothetical protein